LSAYPTGEVISVVLYGWGEWSRAKWAPILVDLARRHMIILTVVDCWPVAEIPDDLLALVLEGVLRYHAWKDEFETDIAASWLVAFVVTSPAAHQEVIHRLLDKAAQLERIVVEKPSGQSLEQALDIFDSCEKLGLTLIIVDHFLLRPAVQFLISYRELLRWIGKPMTIVASIVEARLTGPPQGVIADLLVHLINLLVAIFPGARFEPHQAFIANALEADTRYENYVLAMGSLKLPNGQEIFCEIEAAKCLEDRKSVTVIGSNGKLQLDLISNTLTVACEGQNLKEVSLEWGKSWTYETLILWIIFG
jgi:predicted dehydrogenase